MNVLSVSMFGFPISNWFTNFSLPILLVAFNLSRMPKKKFPRLDHQEKQELIEYWESSRKSYNELSKYFEKKWRKKISLSVVSDVIYQWKKNRHVRGTSKVDLFEESWRSNLSEALGALHSTSLTISPACFYSIFFGELYNQDLVPSSFESKSLEEMFERNHNIVLSAQQHPFCMELADLDKIAADYSPSRTIFVDYFQLFYK